MNFLQLCQRLRSEAGIPGVGPSSVAGQTGELLRVVQWIEEAYEYIQNLYSTWRFLQKSFSFNTIASTSTYTPTGIVLSDLLSWKTNDIRVYLTEGDETLLAFVPWENFRPYYNFGSLRSQEGKPSVVTIKPDNSIMFWPKPDQIYTIDGQYHRVADILDGNIDTPIFAAPYHLAIVWYALMLYAGALGAPDVYAHGQTQYRSVVRKLMASQLPRITFGASLV